MRKPPLFLAAFFARVIAYFSPTEGWAARRAMARGAAGPDGLAAGLVTQHPDADKFYIPPAREVAMYAQTRFPPVSAPPARAAGRAQSLLISLLGVFGPAGGYALAVAGSVYQFKHGQLVRQPLGERHQHMRAIPGRLAVPADLAALDMLVGTRWRLIGTNCLTLLAWRWREDYRAR